MSTFNQDIDPITGRPRIAPAEPLLDEAAPQMSFGEAAQSAASMSQDPTSES